MTTCFLSDGFNIVKVSLILANREKNRKIIILDKLFYSFFKLCVIKILKNS